MSCFNIATFPVQRLLKIVADLLTSICMSNDCIPCTRLSVFDSRAVPPIPIADYMNRIIKFTPYSNEVLLCILIYFDRIAESKRNAITLNSRNIHRFIITSIVIATKSTSDIYYRNSRYAKVGGISLEELYHLEFEFLKLCDFKVHVPLEKLQRYADQIWSLSKNDMTSSLSLKTTAAHSTIPPEDPVQLMTTSLALSIYDSTNTKTLVDQPQDLFLSSSSSSLSSASSSLSSSSSSSSSTSLSSSPSSSSLTSESTSNNSSSVLLPLTPPYDSMGLSVVTTDHHHHHQVKLPSPSSNQLHPYQQPSSSTKLAMAITHPLKITNKKRYLVRSHPYSKGSTKR